MKFDTLNIIDRIQKALTLSGYSEPTEIQKEAIPVLLEGRDLLGSAQTGTGKTAAFAIPILQQIYLNNKIKPSKAIKALILTPTRELASQVYEDFFRYSKFLNIRSTVIFGGVPQNKQASVLRRGVTVLVATPGRLIDLMNQGIVKLNEVEYFVLDEADQMLDMGFVRDVRRIVKNIPNKRQTLLFSATMPKAIIDLSKELLNDPVRIEVTPTHQTIDLITQSVYHVIKKDKNQLLLSIINDHHIKSLLVFTRTKHQANRVCEFLVKSNITAEPIHGNKSQAARERALNNFKAGKTRVLVATDIAARGIDIGGLTHVINYDLPELAETYIHRIGRTGRAGKNGVAISFVEPETINTLRAIERHTKHKIDVIYSHDFHQTETPVKKESRKSSKPKSKKRYNNKKN